MALTIKIIACFLIIIYANSAVSALNPFSKIKTLKIGENMPWKVSQKSLIKSAKIKYKGDFKYFHLMISDEKLTLYLNKNDDALKRDAWDIKTLQVSDIRVDGKRLGRFTWCLENIIDGTKFNILKNKVSIKDNICIIDNVKAEFIIKLDMDSLTKLRQSSKLFIEIYVDKHAFRLHYSMTNFLPAYDKYKSMKAALDKPKNKPVSVVMPKPKPKPIKKSKPIAAIKPHEKLKPKKPKVIKSCKSNPPAKFKKVINAISYPCNDKILQRKANEVIKSRVMKETRKINANKIKLKESKKKITENKEIDNELKKYQKFIEKSVRKRELEQLKIDNTRWIRRCKKHWNRKVSPCFCRPYLKNAPTGVKDTCRK